MISIKYFVSFSYHRGGGAEGTDATHVPKWNKINLDEETASNQKRHQTRERIRKRVRKEERKGENTNNVEGRARKGETESEQQ